MGRIRELIKNFLEPSEIEGTFNELAIASGLSQEEIKELNNTKNGLDWTKFSKEDDEKKKKSKASRKNISKEESNLEQNINRKIRNEKDLER